MWAPSPAWPEGRGVFLLRPLLGHRRAALRGWLAERGESWIDDPANEDLHYARARARRQGPDEQAPPPRPAPEPCALAAACAWDAAGVLTIARDALRATEQAEAAAFVGAACLCASGCTRPPARARLERLMAALQGAQNLAATLAGARIEADSADVRFLREPGETRRGGLAPLAIGTGETAVWDGRFEITADRPLTVRPLAGLSSRLPKAQREGLRAFPPRARAALPAVALGEEVSCLALDPDRCRPLGGARLRAACGLVEREPG